MKRSMWFFGLLLAVAGLSSFRTADIAVSRPDRAQRRSLAKLERSYEYIRKMYVDSVDMAPLVEEAIRSMVQQLDPHTEYASAAEMAEFWSLYRGKFGGIGIQTQWIRDSLVVTSLLSGGAAEEAGIRPDDRIVRVDGRTVKEIPASELISVMRGDAGSKVKILVIRRGFFANRYPFPKLQYNINPKSWVVVISLADSTRSVYSSAYLFSSSVGVFSYKYHNTPGKKPEIHAR